MDGAHHRGVLRDALSHLLGWRPRKRRGNVEVLKSWMSPKEAFDEEGQYVRDDHIVKIRQAHYKKLFPVKFPGPHRNSKLVKPV